MTRNGDRPRKAKRTADEIRIPALEVQQGPNRTLYTFAIDGKQLPRVATVSRVRRNDDAVLQGYQRPAALSHINAIRRYIESPDAMLPNALVIAFDKRVTFESAEERAAGAYSRAGTLIIPVDDTWDDSDKPGWIVDGQQRSTAIRDAEVEQFPVCVSAFITDDESQQRSQFILVNNTKPLPKGLIHELLPTSAGSLPPQLQARRYPALLLERLNHDADSPMRHRIQTPTMPEGVIKDNSVLRMLESSLTDGALYQFRDAQSGGGRTEAMLIMVKNFWTAVSTVFADAWALPPRKSRLTHGVGIISLSFVMDAIVGTVAVGEEIGLDEFITELSKIDEVCHWTSGAWELADGTTRKWNDLQNTSKDIQLLTNHLLGEYRARARGKKRGPRQLRLA
ncbi:DGQHR domain-containing protein DpdB [Saccharothrix obliqua]|uniref:DGQHR domain-containing protein DpdB n=1 Tax=Saccharothrix obliqua TaxID=2861747 RepID=UPI001C5D5076|nr:DGQHR domain-containing protein DpdB [Saccharothrix obliqua]MBW4719404.1 DGQHR domain-containing protein [Saccharothrix obliqua]